jgi:phosphonate transport system substrate-binding protein
MQRRLLLSLALSLAAAGLSPQVVAQTPAVLRVTTIPEEAATEQVRKFTPLAAYLEKALGMKVEFTPVNDYPAAVEALVNKKVDLVWFGGFTHVQANIRSGGKIVPLAQREEDTRFQSVFIAKTDSGIKTLADMKGKQISFGSQSSTSGHLMPRSFLLAANINPEKDFRRIAYSGAHDATIASVVSGKVDAAALDITVWRKFVTENKVDTKAVDVFYTTPGYYNYNWSVHADMPAAQHAPRSRQALLALDPAKPDQAEILRLNRATRYIETKPENYKGLEAAAAAPACSERGQGGAS